MWERLLVAALVAFVVFKVTLITYRRRKYPEPHEDWTNVNLDDVHFPEGFHWGTATAAHQVEGHQANNWTVHEVAKGLCLLYTSPSPRDLSTSRMPSSA